MKKNWAVFSGNTLVSRHWDENAARAASGTAATHVRRWCAGWGCQGGWFKN